MKHSHVDVFHHFKLSASAVAFGHASGADLVDEFTQDLTVLDVLLEQCVFGEFLSHHGFDPFHGFLFQGGVALGRELHIWTTPFVKNYNFTLAKIDKIAIFSFFVCFS